jgi:hypothetical protein
MIKKIDGWDLIPGELYIIKSIGGAITIGEVKFVRYTERNYERPVGLFDAHILGMCLINHNDWVFYTFVSSEEYKKKIREKYDSTCLDIILKRLINETFTW